MSTGWKETWWHIPSHQQWLRKYRRYGGRKRSERWSMRNPTREWRQDYFAHRERVIWVYGGTVEDWNRRYVRSHLKDYPLDRKNLPYRISRAERFLFTIKKGSPEAP